MNDERFDKSQKIKNAVDLVLLQRDAQTRKALGDLLHLLFTVTAQDRIDGESIYLEMMREIYIEDQLSKFALTEWMEKNEWMKK